MVGRLLGWLLWSPLLCEQISFVPFFIALSARTEQAAAIPSQFPRQHARFEGPNESAFKL